MLRKASEPPLHGHFWIAVIALLRPHAAFPERGFSHSPHLALVDGDIGHPATAEKVAQTAIAKFGSIDHVVNNAGIFSVKPFTEYTVDDFHRFVSTNLEGFIFITQLAVKQMLSQGGGWQRNDHHGSAGR